MTLKKLYLSFALKVNPILVGHCFPLFVVRSFPLQNFKWVGVLAVATACATQGVPRNTLT